jgi:hypothetical protein
MGFTVHPTRKQRPNCSWEWPKSLPEEASYQESVNYIVDFFRCAMINHSDSQSLVPLLAKKLEKSRVSVETRWEAVSKKMIVSLQHVW